MTLAFLRFGSDTLGARALKALAGTPPERLLEALADALAVPPAMRGERLNQARLRADLALRQGRAAGLSLLPWFRLGFPELLKEIVDPPVALWTTGQMECLSRPAIAVVGGRRAAPTGLRVARNLGRDLADAGLVVVSGLARGIDAAAHQGALDAGGTTIGVLGCGADAVYPREHDRLAAAMRRSGAVISEFPPGTPPMAHHFPMRNRIISGLCSAVVVIEASQRSGSLITARMALEQGREVLAVPGNVASGQYAGCHALLKDGAALVETVSDVLGALGWPSGSALSPSQVGNPRIISKLEAAMAVGEPYTADELAARTGLAGPELLAELGALEVAGTVGRIPGAGFVRVDKSVIDGGNG